LSSPASGGTIVRVTGMMTNSQVVGNAYDAAANVLTVIGSVGANNLIQAGPAAFAVADRLTIQGARNPAIRVHNQQNGDWDTANDYYGAVEVYSDDVSGGGVGIRGAMRLRTTSNIGSNAFWRFYGSTTSTNDVGMFDMGIASFQPVDDNVKTLGAASNRWSVVYAGTGAINTSDGREKTEPRAFTDAEMRAWGRVSFGVFQWLHAIEAKGDGARLHSGVIAQQLAEAFQAEGLDPARYGVWCRDVLVDETGEPILDEGGAPSYRLGIRPDQAAFWEAAYQRWRMATLEARVAALEAPGTP